MESVLQPAPFTQSIPEPAPDTQSVQEPKLIDLLGLSPTPKALPPLLVPSSSSEPPVLSIFFFFYSSSSTALHHSLDGFVRGHWSPSLTLPWSFLVLRFFSAGSTSTITVSQSTMVFGVVESKKA